VYGQEEDGRGVCSCLLLYSNTHNLAYIGQPKALATSVVVTWLDWKVLYTVALEREA